MEPNKKKKLIDLTVIEEFLESGVSAVALVEEPAIEVDFYAFKKESFVDPRAGESEGDFVSRCIGVLVGDEGYDQDQAAAICYSTWRDQHNKMEFASYTDYPEAAKNNAQRALDWADKNGWGSCGTPVGKVRANQLAKGEPISEDTISRMASFARHKQNSDTPYGEGCGKLMWDAWGGTEGIEWASRKLEEIRNEKFAVDCPPATTDIALNLKNRQNAIDTAHYGPLDPSLPNEDYWKAKADMFGDSVENAKQALCGNCSFFVVSSAIKDCIAQGIGSEVDPEKTIEAGKLGYCEAFDFKCAAKRTCDAWVVGGPIEMDVVVNAPAYIDQTGESNKKKKPILETRPVLLEEETLLAYFSQVGISMNEYNMKFANADLIPWQEGDIMPADGNEGRTYYKYVGPPAERDFCRQMLALDRLYTFQEIDTASGFAVNPGFGERGGATYDIWNYKGGPNCKHRWQKFYAKPNGEIVNKGPATGKAGTPMYDQKNHGYLMSKMYFEETEDQRILVGPAMIPGLEIPRYDKKNKEVFYVTFSEEAVAKVMEKFMREQSVWNTNQDHDGSKPADTYIFESWLIEDPETDKAKTVYGYEGLPKGTWMCKMRVVSDDVWKRVKNGELKGFSVEGDFVTEEQLSEWEKEKELMEMIKEIVR